MKIVQLLKLYDFFCQEILNFSFFIIFMLPLHQTIYFF